MSTHLRIDKCYHCLGPLPPRAKTGRPRLYCSARCRQAAYYARQTRFEVTEQSPADPPRPVTPNPDEAVARAVLEGYTMAGIFLHLGDTARPEFASRCEVVGKGLHELLETNFTRSAGETTP